jgi:UDP-glucuronate 4-epimerase
MKILITGAAGFIGFNLVEILLTFSEFDIYGLDVINDYYDVNLKFARLSEHGIDGKQMKDREIKSSDKFSNYRFLKADLADHDLIVDFMIREKFDCVVNLAAQAGVRYSIDNPRAYIHSNIDGFLSILEGCRYSNVNHLIYASTSSVYGLNTKMPLSEKQNTDHPISFYSVTKKANELMAHNYSHLFNIPTTGLRFFTVYGPWGRPDMALFKFTNAILKDKPIQVFNYGKMVRDFTYVKDVVHTIKLLLARPPEVSLEWDSFSPMGGISSAPYRIFNVGNSNPVELNTYIESLEKSLNKIAVKEFLNIQPGDVPETNSDTTELNEYLGYKPATSVSDGISCFVNWYKNYYNG